MSFEIHTANDEAISIQDLDKEAAEFWGVEVDDKYYAEPKEHKGNWFDNIGHEIHNPSSNWTKGWDNIKCSLVAIQTNDFGLLLYDDEQLEDRISSIKAYLKPYFDLIDHWEAKGYKPIQID